MEQVGSPEESPSSSNVVLGSKESGSSSSTSSLPQGESQAQYAGGNGDLASVYMQAISKSQDNHLLQGSEAHTTHHMVPHNLSTDSEIMMNYQLNLPNDFHLTSPFQWQCMQPPNVAGANIGNLMGNSLDVSQAYWIHQTEGGPLPRSLGIQGTNSPASGYDLVGGSSNYVDDPKSSRQKRKMAWNDDGPPSYKSWSSFGTSDKGKNYASIFSTTDNERYTLYDQRYEAIGLPVDPHLRLFNSINEKGNGVRK